MAWREDRRRRLRRFDGGLPQTTVLQEPEGEELSAGARLLADRRQPRLRGLPLSDFHKVVDEPVLDEELLGAVFPHRRARLRRVVPAFDLAAEEVAVLVNEELHARLLPEGRPRRRARVALADPGLVVPDELVVAEELLARLLPDRRRARRLALPLADLGLAVPEEAAQVGEELHARLLADRRRRGRRDAALFEPGLVPVEEVAVELLQALLAQRARRRARRLPDAGGGSILEEPILTDELRLDLGRRERFRRVPNRRGFRVQDDALAILEPAALGLGDVLVAIADFLGKPRTVVSLMGIRSADFLGKPRTVAKL